MEVTALLPMKAHSSRVPGKNFKTLAGRPLFEWILLTLLAERRVQRVIINTDARTLIETSPLVAQDSVLIRDRRDELLGDEVSMNRILQDDIEHSGPGHYLMTHTTNPLLGADTLSDAISRYERGVGEGFDSLFTVNRVQTRFYRESGEPVNHDPRNLIPTQDLEPWFEENSCLYLFSATSFAKTHARIGQRPLLHEIPRIEAVDIDEQDDWRIAEALKLHDLARA